MDTPLGGLLQNSPPAPCEWRWANVVGKVLQANHDRRRLPSPQGVVESDAGDAKVCDPRALQFGKLLQPSLFPHCHAFYEFARSGVEKFVAGVEGSGHETRWQWQRGYR